jgi:GDP-mannose 4,6-dehydratase
MRASVRSALPAGLVCLALLRFHGCGGERGSGTLAEKNIFTEPGTTIYGVDDGRKFLEEETNVSSDRLLQELSKVPAAEEADRKLDQLGATTKKVLVTGISGMIGSYVAKALCASGEYTVFGLVRWRSSLLNLAGILPEIILEYGDISDSVRMRELVMKIQPDYIFHFAAQAINGVSFGSPEVTLRTNVMGTLNLLEAVKEAIGQGKLSARTRILLAGSSTEYGATADEMNGAPIPETAPHNPVSPYGVSKVAMEKLGFQYFRAHGLQVVVARFFIQVSAGGTEHLALQEFCRQIAMIERGLQEPTLQHGNLNTMRDMTDIQDASPVVVTLAERGVAGQAYNVGSAIKYSIRDLLQTAVSQARVPIALEEDASRKRQYDEAVLVADISKLQALTGWVPKPNMSAIVEQILQHWRREISMRYPEILEKKNRKHKKRRHGNRKRILRK